MLFLSISLGSNAQNYTIFNDYCDNMDAINEAHHPVIRIVNIYKEITDNCSKEFNCHAFAWFLSVGKDACDNMFQTSDPTTCYIECISFYEHQQEYYNYFQIVNSINEATHIEWINNSTGVLAHSAIVSPFNKFPKSDGWVVSYNGPDPDQVVLHKLDDYTNVNRAYEVKMYKYIHDANGAVEFLPVNEPEYCPDPPSNNIIITGPMILPLSGGNYEVPSCSGCTYVWDIQPHINIIPSGNSCFVSPFKSINSGPDLSRGCEIPVYYLTVNVYKNSSLYKKGSKKILGQPLLYSDVKVSPNPAKDFFEVSFNVENINAENQEYELRLIDQFGQTKYVSKTKNIKTRINTSNLKRGVYYLKITGKERTETKKIIIDK